MWMDSIPKTDGAIFIELKEEPGYYIHYLMNKYFNDVQVDKLIPITKYGSYEFNNYYFDKENQKLFKYTNK